MSNLQHIRVTELYNTILKSDLFLLNGHPINLCDMTINLCEAIEDYEGDSEQLWYIGECSYCLSDFIVGAYWSLTEWHRGQASIEYAALCSLGKIYSPGMMDGPEEGSGEYDVYEIINQYFQQHKCPTHLQSCDNDGFCNSCGNQ